MSRQDKATTERHTKTLRELVKRPENKVCADCKRNDPRWASWNLGVFLCIRCSGIHRGMGTHISKVKSVDLDTWTPEQMQSIQSWGNRLANLYWEAHLKPGHIPPEHKMESFVRSKYESRRWALDEPLPSDPSTLDNGSAATAVAPASPSPPPSSRAARVSNTQTSTLRAASPVFQSPVTSRQPQAHKLLSTNHINQPARASAETVPVAQQQPVAQPQSMAAQDDLFCLDFHAPASNVTRVESSQPKKDVKQDILSLFSSPAATTPASASSSVFSQLAATPLQSASPWNQTISPHGHEQTSMMGTNGVGAWGVSSGWSVPAAQPQQSNIWGGATSSSQQQQQVFGNNELWGSAPTTGGAGAQAMFSAPASSAKKDDVFGDLWGGFK